MFNLFKRKNKEQKATFLTIPKDANGKNIEQVSTIVPQAYINRTTIIEDKVNDTVRVVTVTPTWDNERYSNIKYV